MAVLDLQRPTIPLYVYDNPLAHNDRYFMSPFDRLDPSSQVLRFSSISARLLLHEDEDVLVFRISFWVDQISQPIYTTKVATPNGWNCRMYLAAVNLTIRRQNLVICAPRHILGGTHCSINYIHLLYTLEKRASLELLYNENAFRYIVGGLGMFILSALF